MKKLLNITLVLALALTFASQLNAQEEMKDEAGVTVVQDLMVDASTTEEMSSDASSTEEISDDMDSEKPTEEEIQVILEENETLDNEIDSLDDLEGEVISVTDDEVVIQKEDGDIVVVDVEVYAEQSSNGSSRKPQAGEKVESGEVSKAEDTTTVTTKSGTYTINNNTYITRNGEEATLDDVKEGDNATVVLDKDGNVVAVDFTSGIDDAKNTVIIASLLALIALIAAAVVLRNKGVETV